MKLPYFSAILSIVTVLSSALTLSQPANAAKDKYFCAQLHGVYHTFARSDRGKIKMLSFLRDVPKSWDKRKRCIEVAKRFQRFYDHTMLRFIGTGEVNAQPVLCALSQKSELCHSGNVLVTLPPNTNPREAARQLMNVRDLARGNSIPVSGLNQLETHNSNGNSFYDLEFFEEFILESKDKNFLIQEDLTPIKKY